LSYLRTNLERDFVGRDLELLVEVVNDPSELVTPLRAIEIAGGGTHDTAQ
jgi:hypothetical protein